MSRAGILLVGHHRRVAHSGEKIIGLVLFAHVIETEAPIVLLSPSPFRSAMLRLFLAPMPSQLDRLFSAGDLFRFDADTVKEG